MAIIVLHYIYSFLTSADCYIIRDLFLFHAVFSFSGNTKEERGKKEREREREDDRDEMGEGQTGGGMEGEEQRGRERETKTETERRGEERVLSIFPQE